MKWLLRTLFIPHELNLPHTLHTNKGMSDSFKCFLSYEVTYITDNVVRTTVSLRRRNNFSPYLWCSEFKGKLRYKKYSCLYKWSTWAPESDWVLYRTENYLSPTGKATRFLDPPVSGLALTSTEKFRLPCKLTAKVSLSVHSKSIKRICYSAYRI